MSHPVSQSFPSELLSKPGDPVWEIAYLFPPQGSWSAEEYLSLGTNRLIEFDNGCLEILPMPTLAHQLMVQFLYHALHTFVSQHELGQVLFAPLPVRLWAEKYRAPDIVFLRPERMRDLDSQPDGADLVVEVLSGGETNRRRDLVDKRRDYARAGISEYWIVDPEQRAVEVLALDGAAYRTHGRFEPPDAATSLLLHGFSVAVAEVFSAAERRPETRTPTADGGAARR